MRRIGTGFAEPSHLRQRILELAQRLAVPLAKPIEQRAPMRIGERPEDRLQYFHRSTICDRLVTCQEVGGIPR